MNYKSLNSGYQKPEINQRVEYIKPSDIHRTLGDTKYLQYNEPDFHKRMDLNTISGKDLKKISEFPNLAFTGQPYYTSPYICSPVRDTTRHYVINVERKNHPQHFSRYGYARTFTGYTPTTPGKWDPNGEACYADPQPLNMAPPQYYCNQFIGQCNDCGNSSMSQAWNESYWARNL